MRLSHIQLTFIQKGTFNSLSQRGKISRSQEPLKLHRFIPSFPQINNLSEFFLFNNFLLKYIYKLFIYFGKKLLLIVL